MISFAVIILKKMVFLPNYFVEGDCVIFWSSLAHACYVYPAKSDEIRFAGMFHHRGLSVLLEETLLHRTLLLKLLFSLFSL